LGIRKLPNLRFKASRPEPIADPSTAETDAPTDATAP